MITLKPHDDYYYQNPYFLLNGAEDLVADFMHHMTQSGIAVDYHARAKYPARNQKQYDWFIKAEESTSLNTIYKLVSDYNRKLSAGRGYELENQDELRKRYLTLQNELDTLRQRSKGQEGTTVSLQKSISDLEGELDLFVNENKELVAKITTQEILLDEVSLDQDQLILMLQIARTRILDLEAQNHDLQSQSQLPEPAPKERGIESVMTAMWQEVNFLRDSIARVEMEFDFKQIMPKLRRIIDQNEQGKPIQSVPGWHEIHFSTGKSDDGRIYYTYRDGNGSRRILISKKNRQKTDFDFLKL